MAYEGMTAETVEIKGANGDLIDAYLARPMGEGPFPGVIVAHHMPGWDEWCMEITRRFAHHGYAAICPNLHHRMGPGTPTENSERIRESGGQVDELVVGDIAGALDYLRSSTPSTGKVGVIGFCSGGRVVLMVSAKVPSLDAAVACWSGNVIPAPDRITPNQPVPVFEMLPDVNCPVLGIFGNDDGNPDPEQVNKIEAELKKHGKTYDFHRYDGAGHAFFRWEAKSHRPEQAADAWAKVWAFYAQHLGVGAKAAAAVG